MIIKSSKNSTRISSIDILKFIAVFAVINSHMDIAYGEYAAFGTGGAYGDALFFFASGFMLFRGATLRFDNFMKKRIARIYPSVIVVALIQAIVYGYGPDIFHSFILGGGWFVNCIMIYYVILYIIKRWGLKYMRIIWWALSLIIIGAYYSLFRDNISLNFFWIYGYNYYKWIFFFSTMLLGAQMGLHYERYIYNNWVIPKLVGCSALWGIFPLLGGRFPILFSLQYLSILPLTGMVYYTYLLCCAPALDKLYHKKVSGQIIYILGSLCLESYLVQYSIITDKLNYLFPINVLVILLAILVAAYIVNFLASAFKATFEKEGYDWREYLLYRR